MVSICCHAWCSLKSPGVLCIGSTLVFIAQLVGRDQECSSGVACSAGFRSRVNQPNSFANVSAELCWAYVGVLLQSVFHGRQVGEAVYTCHLFQFDDWSREVSTRFQNHCELEVGGESSAEGSSWKIDLANERYLPLGRSLVSAFRDLHAVWFLWSLETAIKVDLEWKYFILPFGLLECHGFSYAGF